MRKLIQSLFLVVAMLMMTLPAHAGMVGTAQLQAAAPASVAIDVAAERLWIEQQLVRGGVPQGDAQGRVAALTDAQVVALHQRIEQEPAGGNALVILILIGIIAEMAGWIDIVPDWP